MVRDEHVVHLGRRDGQEAEQASSQRIEDCDIAVIDLAVIREHGAARVAHDAVDRLRRSGVEGFWVHLDCDVVADTLMPAVDYRLPGGLSWDELQTMLRVARDGGDVVGLEVTIFNPALDPDGAIARDLVACLVTGLAEREPRSG